MDMLADDPPLTGADLDSWVGQTPVEERPLRLAFGGLGLVGSVGRDGSRRPLPRELRLVARDEPVPPFLRWALTVARLTEGPALDVSAGGELPPRHFDAEIPASQQRSPLRLAVTGNVVPGEVIPRLLACPGVGSAVIPVRRPPAALRRRAWHWPPRIGVAEDGLLKAFSAQRSDWILPPELVDVSDIRVDGAGVDLLVLRGTPAEAAFLVASRRQLAGLVLCIGDAGGPWPVVDAYLALVRAATGAAATALVQPDDAATIVEHLLRSLRFVTHGHPLDVALTSGFGGRLLLAGETAALEGASLPRMLRRRAQQLRHDYEVMSAGAEPPEPPEQWMPPTVVGGGVSVMPPAPPSIWWGGVSSVPTPSPVQEMLSRLEALPDGAFDHESAEAFLAVDPVAAVEAALDTAAVSRYLQAWVGPVTTDGASRDNVLRPGTNAVDVFIGPEEIGALQGPAAPDALLGLEDPAIDQARLTVVLVPLVPRGEPIRTELDVPRAGRSRDARLVWTLPEGKVLVQSRIMVLHRNRVIQTALLSGRVGSAARLTERLILWDKLNHLDDRRPFSRAFVLNHDDKGVPALISHADGTTTIEAMSEVDAITERIRRYLLTATQMRSPRGAAATEAMRKILVDVAVEGNDLFVTLEDQLAGLGNLVAGDRIQIVTARSGRFLPLEMVYSRPAPDEDAVLCPNWVAAQQCGDQCFVGEEDTSVVCPAVFWGMSLVIERHHTSLTDVAGTSFLVSANPTRERSTLHITSALLAASEKVKAADLKLTASALPPGTAAVVTLKAWRDALKAVPATDLLVLMPHTDQAVKTLEISGEKLRNGRIDTRYVTGGQQVSPVVVLFGCDTAGSDEDPAGYATRFMARGAAVVFSTLTMLLAGHAAALSRQLAILLRTPGRAEQPLGELVTAFRREAVRGGLVSALAVTAYGDADWKV